MSFEIHDQKLYHYFPESEEEHEIVIPEGVISIEEKAFESAENLKEIFLPDSLVCIHKEAFENCRNLDELWIPDKLERIGEAAFRYCDSLELISPASLRGILEESEDETILRMCSQLNLQSIEQAAFLGCSSLGVVLLSDKMKEIGDEAFERCDALHFLCIPKDSNSPEMLRRHLVDMVRLKIRPKYSDRLEIGYHAFRGCLKLTEFFYDGICISQHEWDEDDEDDESDDRYWPPEGWVNLIRGTRSFFASDYAEYSDYLSEKRYLCISSSISERYLYILSHPENLSILSETLRSEMIPIEFIDKAISYANAHEFYESQMLLMNYRIQHANSEDIWKKFEL